MARPHWVTPRPRLRRCGPRVEELEPRWVPAAIVYSTSGLDGPNSLVLRLDSSGTQLKLLDNGQIVAQELLSDVTSVQITGAAGETDTLTINYGPGFFTVPISFIGGAGGGDGIVVSADVDFTLTDTDPPLPDLTTSQGSPVFLDGVEQARLTGGAGDNSINATGFAGSTTLDGGDGDDTLIGGPGTDVL